jgi:hypothetical protein
MRDSRNYLVGAVCEFGGCDRLQSAKGLCIGHYLQMWRGQALRPLIPQTSRDGTCTVAGCERRRRARGLCNTHYAQLRQARMDLQLTEALCGAARADRLPRSPHERSF